MRLSAAAAWAGVGAMMITGCAAGTGSGSGAGKVVDGGTFTFAVNADPGSLDPQASPSDAAIQIGQFAYDHLLNADADGKIVSGLATSWKTTGKKVVMSLHQGVTCSDGSAFTAADVAANINYVADPKNKSPLLGVLLPAGAHATADTSAGTVTLTLAGPAPFVTYGLAGLPMVCAKGMQNRSALVHKTLGTGPYQLTRSVAGNEYTYRKRRGYTWGPNGIGTATKGLPDTIVVKVVSDQTTAANLLMSGALNAATVTGADTSRLEGQHLFSTSSPLVTGEMWFNQAKSRPAADASVRRALTQALDLAQLRQVLTAGKGTAPTTFTVTEPPVCPGDSLTKALPAHDLDAAERVLDDAGWKRASGGVREKDGHKLSLTFVHNTSLGAGGTAAAELAVQTWQKLGVQITSRPQDETRIGQTLFTTGDWDIIWEALNTGSPDQMAPFLSGPVPPAGTNFAHIDNADYSAGITQATDSVGTKGCPKWLAAESALAKDADVVPFANQATRMFGSGAKFEYAGSLIPTSIRMLAR
ncbi:peptide/nickel transport system substrate-binding protein [Streptomyces sp. Ag109_O5-1]|uniref:ABC transporter substrate-binding protein n=1 Tax=Streptomyces sp. Ag109_O5-1 TaxID=1938851 RepID=UPI000F51613E|nr:ABC transporter substrate-binding protein [Streptomyces sp. Ag109_O5-1]RPE39203.1 peptide/nickel transport system substrate-binding protein [Streptomyces sp. Ag109_O5-1]